MVVCSNFSRKTYLNLVVLGVKSNRNVYSDHLGWYIYSSGFRFEVEFHVMHLLDCHFLLKNALPCISSYILIVLFKIRWFMISDKLLRSLETLAILVLLPTLFYDLVSARFSFRWVLLHLILCIHYIVILTHWTGWGSIPLYHQRHVSTGCRR